VIPTLANGLLAAASRRDTPAVAAIGRVLWAATSARGRKAALRFFPNSVDAFEPVARLLAGAAGVGVGGGSGAEDCPWAAVGADLGREGDAASPSNLDDRPVGGGGGGGRRAGPAGAARPPPPPPPPPRPAAGRGPPPPPPRQ